MPASIPASANGEGGGRASATIQGQTVGAVMCDLAHRLPDRVAFVDGERRFTFAQFNARVNQLNHAVLAQGLKPGDRVAVLARNRVETLEALGLAKSGMVLVPLNWRLSDGEILALLRHSAPRLLFVDELEAKRLEALGHELPPELRIIRWTTEPDAASSYETWLATQPEHEPAAVAKAQDLACLLYTSGTTGAPKAVALSQNFITGNARSSATAVSGLRDDDTVLAALPFFHVGGLFFHAFASYWRGCTTHILPRFDAAEVLTQLAQQRIRHVHLVPTMIAALFDQPGFDAADLSHLRMMFYAASSMPQSLLRRAMARLPHCEFVQSYGSTELGVVTVLDPATHRAAAASEPGLLASCGRAVPGVHVRIAGEQGQALAPGEVGEIQVRSPWTLTEYRDNPEATQALRDGDWWRSGDLGRLDEAGWLFLVDRKNDMIVTGGENVYPSEVEACLSAWPEIREVAVFALPDPRWVERVVAAIVLQPGAQLDAATVRSRLKSELAAYKCPQEVFWRSSLPKNATGKVLRAALRREYEGAAESGAS